ncbi:TSC22 domain family protein 2-like isoform X2 [Poeciliopsis prolifica]|uniref:TSC22 domain family protein 2-like isoform X2 n=1 Tax=Poeciliopsis prolifica TaxID=188132 RepID=UPI002413AE00|nr:TSC22 domain family protein 2-like isoform X2 [Poeciliopsis prolifica]
MSKMPAKKKSCFQITSVTQAQVAAVGAADDTESLDDPDESRTEDMSSEIYDVSRAEYEPACERSSSDEALNNVGEAEAPANAPQATLPPGPGGNTTEPRKVVGSGSVHGGQNQLGISLTPGAVQLQPTATASPSVSANTSQPAGGSSSATSTVSCSSRFRVIKLDHGTGEPFRRGRWTCTEFYEKDSGTDSIRHGSVTLDPAAERDSGLGPSVGSTVSPATHSGPGLGSMAEGSPALLPPQVLHQNYSNQQHAGSTSATHTSFSSVKPVTLPSQSSIGGLQPHAAQSMLPVGQNGLPHSEVLIQKSPMMPPPYAPQQPVPGVHPIASQTSGLAQHQTEYYPQPQHASIPPGLPGGTQALPVSSLSAVTGGHIPAPASAVSQAGDVGPAVVGVVSSGPPAPQTVGFGVPGGPVLLPLQTVTQYAPAVQPQPMGHPVVTGVQNVPAVGGGCSAPASAAATAATVLSASSATMPNATTSSLPPGLIAHTKTPGLLGVQGLPATGFGQVEASGRKSEGAAIAQSPVVSGRDGGKPFMPEALQLSTPTVTSLFGILPVDGEEDSASGTNIVAIDNKIEQAMDLVKSHLMYAVREEVEVLKEQIKELFERNSVLERENAVLKSLANSEQLSQLTAQTGAGPAAAATAAAPGSTSPPGLQQLHPKPQQLQPQQPQTQQPQTQLDAGQQPQPNVTSA